MIPKDKLYVDFLNVCLDKSRWVSEAITACFLSSFLYIQWMQQDKSKNTAGQRGNDVKMGKSFTEAQEEKKMVT